MKRLVVAVLLSIAFGAFVNAALAQECPHPLDTVTAAIVADGGELVDLVPVGGADFDQLAIFRVGEVVVAGRVYEGCLVSNPIPVGVAAPEPVPA